jgi:hypothetical protein
MKSTGSGRAVGRQGKENRGVRLDEEKNHIRINICFIALDHRRFHTT